MSVVVELSPRGTFRSEVAARLRQAIAARNIKKSDVAAWVEMNITSFSKRLNGHLPLDVDEIDTIADAAGIERNWLLTGAGPMLDPGWLCPQQGSNLRPAD